MTVIERTNTPFFTQTFLFCIGVVVSTTLHFCRVSTAPYCFTFKLTFVDQISEVYPSISSFVCLVVGCGLFCVLQTRVVRL